MYVDGILVAEERDSSDTPDGLRILIGQLFSFTTGPNAGIRPFVGELAEVALYGRALSVEEITKHIKLAREETAD
jgi:Concanavalin A-like lectin/glucanases superfamily